MKQHKVLTELEEELRHLRGPLLPREYLRTAKEIRKLIRAQGRCKHTSLIWTDMILSSHSLPISRATVMEWIRMRERNSKKNRSRNRIYLKKPDKKKMEKKMAEILRLVDEEGLTCYRIAKTLGEHPFPIYRLLKRARERFPRKGSNESTSVEEGRDHPTHNNPMQTQTHPTRTPTMRQKEAGEDRIL